MNRMKYKSAVSTWHLPRKVRNGNFERNRCCSFFISRLCLSQGRHTKWHWKRFLNWSGAHIFISKKYAHCNASTWKHFSIVFMLFSFQWPIRLYSSRDTMTRGLSSSPRTPKEYLHARITCTKCARYNSAYTHYITGPQMGQNNTVWITERPK